MLTHSCVDSWQNGCKETFYRTLVYGKVLWRILLSQRYDYDFPNYACDSIKGKLKINIMIQWMDFCAFSWELGAKHCKEVDLFNEFLSLPLQFELPKDQGIWQRFWK